jgi:hypothetical protein
MVLDKVKENWARRKLKRMGYRLHKTRTRDPDATMYGVYVIVPIRGRGREVIVSALDDVYAWIDTNRRRR